MNSSMKKIMGTTLLAFSLFCSQPGQTAELAMALWSLEHPALASLLITTFSPTIVPAAIFEGVSGLSKEMGLRREEIRATKEDALHLLESGEMSPELAEVFAVVRTNFPETQKISNQRIAVQLLNAIDADSF
jgi:hypothetical protein